MFFDDFNFQVPKEDREDFKSVKKFVVETFKMEIIVCNGAGDEVFQAREAWVMTRRIVACLTSNGGTANTFCAFYSIFNMISCYRTNIQCRNLQK